MVDLGMEPTVLAFRFNVEQHRYGRIVLRGIKPLSSKSLRVQYRVTEMVAGLVDCGGVGRYRIADR